MQQHDTTADDGTDATLTEYLSNSNNENHNEPAKVMHYKSGPSWKVGSYEVLDEDPSEYRAECSCGETFTNWGVATAHVEEEH